MKHLSVLACLLMMAIMAMAAPSSEKTMTGNKPYKIMVISDIHLLAPSLHDNGVAATQLDASDMKLALESDIIVEQMVDEIAQKQPALLLITGDLTFNGARASHERLVNHLKHLEQQGVRTLVIPGNHDVLNPYSRSYLGNKVQPVPSVTAQEFAMIYHDYGYGSDSERDPSSLSYICEPIPGLLVLAIDSNRYSENRSLTRGDSIDVYFNSGNIKDSTLEWIASNETLQQARSQGKKVIAMMHHHLVEHIDGEAKMLPNYIVKNSEQVCKSLLQAGAHVVFTGHLHITDAATTDAIVDVSTGSASTYPLPMRTAVVDSDLSTMSITTHFFDDIDTDIVQKGLSKIKNSAPALAGLVSSRLWSRLSKQMGQMKEMLSSQGIDVTRLPQDERELRELMLRHLQQPLTQSLLAITQGNENPQEAPAIIDAFKKGLLGMIAEVMPDQADMVGDFLLESLMPRVEPMLRSALEDVNHMGTPQQSSTPDHAPKIAL